MWEAIRCAKDLGFRGIILIGHPTYYPRFGFRPGREFGLTCEFEVPDEVFLALPLIEEGFQGVSGRILFPSPFRGIES
jgi:predicted N-acetyltransferase YhbS